MCVCVEGGVAAEVPSPLLTEPRVVSGGGVREGRTEIEIRGK